VHFPFKKFGFQIDLGRQIERPDVLISAVKGMSRFGYNICMLYLEDAYKFERHPLIGRNNAYTKEFMREIQHLCAEQNIELIPVIPSLGHCSYISSKRGYEKYDEGRGTENNFGSVSPSFPETYDLLKDLYKDWCDYIPGRYLHVGLDESASMGNYHIRTFGRENFDAVKMFADHCNKLNAICKSLNRQMVMWGDMLYYLSRAIGLLDKDIIINDWYYYNFEKYPRIELFNFAETDLSGDLKKAGFEVWGCSSIWPNSPFPPIAERWQTLCDWVRYGKEKQIDGIIITDWENSAGFYSNIDLLYRAFGSNIRQSNPDPIDKKISQLLNEITGSDCSGVVSDILELGNYHFTGHENRRLVFSPLVIRANKNRQDQCRQKYDNLQKMFSKMSSLIQQTPNESGKQMLDNIYLSWKFLKLLWKLGAYLPDYYQQLCDAAAENKSCAYLNNVFMTLAGEIEIFKDEYAARWNQLRYEDDRQIITKWANDAINVLRSWALLIQNNHIENHPLIATPRIECTLHCRHPALPVVLITAMWHDGHKESNGETMICFESKYAKPNVKWRQFPSIPLERRELPDRIKFDANNYGQVGIEDVYVILKGIKYAYKAVKFEGENISSDNDGILWLGPICASIDSPLTRTNSDIAWFERI